ncbi:iron-containing alcohol dehydrogenase [Blautia sp. An81]|uniref:iron-containing alcohol dehydrogenase n=1 Tax=Blautia sp. An81 TaxID=1965659 RepID=UPI000B378C4F|nr:iron-containing alcohol dehydrogenase [Blautia sp. An81]OUN31506.1 NADH-dependent alcohol dehydrogenase [Blautia sp. An81]
MNNFIYENKTKVFFGRGCVKEFLTCLVKDYDTIMMGYGQGSVKRNGIYDEVLGILMREGKTVVEFPGIMPNPTYKKVMEGVKLARAHQVQMILGIGGGSVMDCCKAVALAARYKGDAWENFWDRKGIVDFEPIPVGVIPTTAGTGSECNGAAVITNEEEKVKIGYDYPKCNPEFALMDPAYTFSVPKEQMVSGAFDSLSHIMETYFSGPDRDNVSDDVAEALMRNVVRNLRTAVKDQEDYTARSNLFWNSTLSENRLIKLGKKGDFGCHLMEHQLAAYTDCNHGEGMAVLHPVYYRHIYRDGLKKFVRFARNVWEISGEGKSEEALAEAGIDALADFIREIGLPATLRELGMKDRKQLGEIAESCHFSPGSYRKMTSGEILEIFQECF